MFIVLGTDGKEYGPVSAGQVRAWMMDGRANLETKAKLHDGTSWQTLGHYPEFGGSVSPIPPREVSANPFTPAPALAVNSIRAQPSASRWRRFAAAMIDGLLKILAWSPVSIAVWHMLSEQVANGHQPTVAAILEVVNSAFGRALPLLVFLALVQGTLLAWRSQSLGKLLLGLRIVRADSGEPAGFLHGFLIRGTVTLFLEQVPFLGFVFLIVDSAFIFSETRRCLHDLMAGTRVVRA